MTEKELTASDIEMEELVLKESIVSATGLGNAELLVGIKGDPSLRETTLERKKYQSPVDAIIDDLVVTVQDLLLNRSSYRVYIGFNSGEVHTYSIFDPLRYEIHEGTRLMEAEYVHRHFPSISYEDKIQAMREIYDVIIKSKYMDKVPSYWRNIFQKRHEQWQPMDKSEIITIMGSLKTMRDMPDFYLRNITICIVQDMIRLQFNCDGTQIVRSEHYKKFLEDNMP